MILQQMIKQVRLYHSTINVKLCHRKKKENGKYNLIGFRAIHGRFYFGFFFHKSIGAKKENVPAN